MERLSQAEIEFIQHWLTAEGRHPPPCLCSQPDPEQWRPRRIIAIASRGETAGNWHAAGQGAYQVLLVCQRCAMTALLDVEQLGLNWV